MVAKLLVGAISAGLLTMHAFAGSRLMKPEIEQYAHKEKPALIKLVLTPKITQAIQKENIIISKYKIKDLKIQNKQWRAQRDAKNRPLINKILNNNLSQNLDQILSHNKNKLAGILVLSQKASVIGATYQPRDSYFAGRGIWRYAKHMQQSYIGPDRIDHSNNKRWTLVGLPVIQNHKLISVVGVRLYLPSST